MNTWFGVYLPQVRMDYPRILARTRAAQAAGYDSVWLMDHLAAPAAPEFDTLEGWTLAAALLAETDQVRIGHLVTCDPFRHPSVLAKMAATLDRISNGRLDLGIGWGSVPGELESYGFGSDPPSARAARLRESLAIVRSMFAGTPFDHTGEHFSLAGAIGRPVPVQNPLPIHVGGAGEHLTMPIVREYADWWNCPCYAADRVGELIGLARPARASIQRPIGLVRPGDDAGSVRATAERRYGGWGGLVTGTADDVTAALRADAEVGVEGWILQFHDFGEPETLRYFMDTVAPNLR